MNVYEVRIYETVVHTLTLERDTSEDEVMAEVTDNCRHYLQEATVSDSYIDTVEIELVETVGAPDPIRDKNREDDI